LDVSFLSMAGAQVVAKPPEATTDLREVVVSVERVTQTLQS
jgi:hypothetical protein